MGGFGGETLNQIQELGFPTMAFFRFEAGCCDYEQNLPETGFPSVSTRSTPFSPGSGEAAPLEIRVSVPGLRGPARCWEGAGPRRAAGPRGADPPRQRATPTPGEAAARAKPRPRHPPRVGLQGACCLRPAVAAGPRPLAGVPTSPLLVVQPQRLLSPGKPVSGPQREEMNAARGGGSGHSERAVAVRADLARPEAG